MEEKWFIEGKLYSSFGPFPVLSKGNCTAPSVLFPFCLQPPSKAEFPRKVEKEVRTEVEDDIYSLSLGKPGLNLFSLPR